MIEVIDWVMVALLAGFLLGCLRGWQVDRRWWMRLVCALFGLGFAIMTPAAAWSVYHGYHFDLPVRQWPALMVATGTIWAGVIYWWLVQQRPLMPGETTRKRGCFRTILSIVGCAIVGYAMFVLVVVLIAFGIYLSGQLS